jgi:hypothetical protein
MTRRRALFSLFAVILMLVQSHGLWHQHDLDEHDHYCVFCVALAPLEHGLSTAIQPALFISEFAGIAPDSGTASVPSSTILVYSSRAPPASQLS